MDTSLWSELSDKYEVRKYVKERCGEKYLTKLYGVYDRTADIDFDLLPDKYVIKTNNGCGTNIFVKSKKDENREKIKAQLENWLYYPYGVVTGQKHYTAIPPKIIAEQFLFNNGFIEESLIDYKFYCFNGIPIYCHVLSDRKLDNERAHSFNEMFYDMNWHPVPEAFKRDTKLKNVERPTKLEEMIEIAKSLSTNIPYVRVDLYQVNDEVKFGEMTFMPGFDPGYTRDLQKQMGKMIRI